MGQALDTMNRFFKAMQSPDGMDEVAALIDDDFDFAGPVMASRGAQAFLNMLQQFGCGEFGFEFRSQFENGDEVCSLYTLTLTSPAGENVAIPMSDWARIENGRLKAQRILYDPRPFLKAFGMDPQTAAG